MERRTFLCSIAASVGGLLAWRPSAATNPKWTPPPRWEWEVGEWYLLCPHYECPPHYGVDSFGKPFVDEGELYRTWTASATVVYEELPAMNTAVGTCNASGVWLSSEGCLRVAKVTAKYEGDGLLECEVMLEERGRRQDGVEIAHPETMKKEWFQHSRLVDFQNVFRGGHAVTKSSAAKRQWDEIGGWVGLNANGPRVLRVKQTMEGIT